MKYVIAMQIVQAQQNLPDDDTCLWFGYRLTTLDKPIECSMLQEWRQYIEVLVVFEKALQRENIVTLFCWVRQLVVQFQRGHYIVKDFFILPLAFTDYFSDKYEICLRLLKLKTAGVLPLTNELHLPVVAISHFNLYFVFAERVFIYDMFTNYQVVECRHTDFPRAQFAKLVFHLELEEFLQIGREQWEWFAAFAPKEIALDIGLLRFDSLLDLSK
jgi:hypothetical protein